MHPCPTADLLAQRHKTHGSFADNAAMSQRLKRVLRGSANWERLNCEQREALEMIALKLSRLLSGDPTLPDHVHDICGYAELLARATEAARRAEHAGS
jgi:hypothetical protein